MTPETFDRTERGLRRIFHVLGMLPDYRSDSSQGTLTLHAKGSIYAYQAGLFKPLKSISGDVFNGKINAGIRHNETPSQEPDEVSSTHDGLALAMRAMAQVRRGDALYQIALDAGKCG